jgi:rare lipoprotein A
MVIARKTRNLRRAAQLWFPVVAAVSAVALVAGVLLLTARVVQADAGLSRPTLAAPVSPPAASATPASLAKQAAPVSQSMPTKAARLWKDKIHGIASWYGGVFNGRRTASGELYDMYAMTACHPTLPFGSMVRVVNRANHRSVVVRITDRGDLINEGRVIDLSYGAAQQIGMTWSGLAHVDLQVLSLGRNQTDK